jgi:hypothetical protein
MGQVIPKQHPAVVLGRHYDAVRALLVAALAVVALGAAVAILADDFDTKVSVAPKSAQVLQPGTRFDGGPDEGTRGIQPQTVAPGTRFDGGPDEGTRGIQPQTVAPGTRFDGGPDEGTRGPQASYESPLRSYQPAPADSAEDRAGGPRMIPQGPGARQ